MSRSSTFVTGLLLIASGAVAQGGPQPILVAQFSFSNPGARSLGFGGAFVALADDATAAWANPAGLIQISRPEVSLEGRYWSYSTPFIVGGRIEGSPTGIGLDRVEGLRTGTSAYTDTDLAFFSFVYPGNRWSVAFYRHILANLDTLSQTQGLFSETDDGRVIRFLDQRNRSVLEVVSYGLSGAYRLTDSFSVGAGVVYYESSAQIQSDLYLWDDLDDPMGGGTSYLLERSVIGQTLYGDGRNLSPTGGFLWRIDPRWSVGGRFRLGPELHMWGQARAGYALDLGVPPGTVVDLELEETADLPDNYGLGVVFRSLGGHLTISFEWDRVTYSDPLESLEIEDQEIDDADELHCGGEWVFLGTRPLVALRAGLWHDPDHLTRTNGLADDFTRALLQPGEDELHFAIGLGVAFERFQLDAAVDFSDSADTASVSLIYSF